jgi:PAS domain-containing protein
MAETSYERAVVRAILENPHVSVIATGQDGIIRFFNKGAENLLGYKAEEMIGKQKTLVFADPAEAEQHAAELSRQYGVAVGGGRDGIITGPTITGEPEDRVWTYIRKDGSRRKVLMSLNILRDEGSKMLGYIGISIPVPEP